MFGSPGGWSPQGRSKTGGGGHARVPNLRVCKHLGAEWHTQSEKGESRCPAVVPSSRRGKYLQLDAQDRAARKGKWSPRGTGITVLTYPGMRPSNRQGWWKTVKIQETRRQLILDKTVGSQSLPMCHEDQIAGRGDNFTAA